MRQVSSWLIRFPGGKLTVCSSCPPDLTYISYRLYEPGQNDFHVIEHFHLLEIDKGIV